MSQFPGSIHYKDAMKVAGFLGFIKRDQNSSHIQFKKAGVRGFPIPTYKQITVRSHLFDSLLRSMMISKKEFFDILKKVY